MDFYLEHPVYAVFRAILFVLERGTRVRFEEGGGRILSRVLDR